MPLILFTTHDNNIYEADIPVGTSLMQGAVDNMIDGIKGECGGNMRCATCICILDDAQLNSMGTATGAELDLLKATTDYEDHYRLSCQITIKENMDGMNVTLPESHY